MLMHRYGVSKTVIVSVRGGRNYRLFTGVHEDGIRGFSRITPEQIKLIRTIPDRTAPQARTGSRVEQRQSVPQTRIDSHSGPAS